MAITTIKSINIEPTLLSKINNSISDAPSDGKTYGRKDGAWSEAAGSSYVDTLSVTVGSGGDYADLSDLVSAMATIHGRVLQVEVLSSLTMPISGEVFFPFDKVYLDAGVSGQSLPAGRYEARGTLHGRYGGGDFRYSPNVVLVRFGGQIGGSDTFKTSSAGIIKLIDPVSCSITVDSGGFKADIVIEGGSVNYVTNAYNSGDVTLYNTLVTNSAAAAGRMFIKGCTSLYKALFYGTLDDNLVVCTGSAYVGEINLDGRTGSLGASTGLLKGRGFLHVDKITDTTGRYTTLLADSRTANTADKYGLVTVNI